MTSSYQYQPLGSPSTEIRLLELLPGRGTIECQLRITDLASARNTYEPISYCWNSYSRKGWPICTYKEKKKKENKSVRVRVDGFGFHITKSLAAALRQIRLMSGVRVLWADAICINQSDDGEKSAQVAIMGKIYQSGKQTLAWLGDADCWTGKVFRTLRIVLSQIPEDSSSSEFYQDSEDEPEYHPGDTGATSLHSRHLQLVRGLCQDVLSYLSFRSIVQRPYFDRAWIIQEILLSENVLVMCGKYSITGDKLYEGFTNCGKSVPSRAFLIKYSIGKLWKTQEPYCLDTIITKLSHTKTSDARDKLYSILGLHQSCPKCGSMVVDYSKDTDEVFLDATKLLLSRSSSLDFLSMSYCTNRPDGTRVPSWAWDPQPRSTNFNLSSADAEMTNPFCASQRGRSQPHFQGQRLGLLGYVFETVNLVGKAFPDGPKRVKYDVVLEGLLCYFSWLDISGIYEPGITKAESDRRVCYFRCTLKPFQERFARTGSANSNWFSEENARDFESFHGEIMKRFGKFFSPGGNPTSIRAKLELCATLASFHRVFFGGYARAERWTDFIWGVGVVFDRCFVRLTNGRYALCPRDTMQNDRLVLLQGANVPWVLRPSGKNWVLVGECFVYGIMYGEHWKPELCKMLWIE